MSSEGGWIGVDLDGTLAEYHGWQGPTHIGPAIPAMLRRVQRWVGRGIEVRIVTARVSGFNPTTVRIAIWQWLEDHNLPRLPITNEKDYGMVELWDDRAVQVERNTGRRMDGVQDE